MTPSRQLGLAGGLGLAAAFLLAPARSQPRVTKYKAAYAAEARPVARAKILAKLGRAEFKAAWREVSAGHYGAALALLRDYRDRAHATHQALDAMHVNAEKHSGGFRQLQISLRESVRQLGELSIRVPFAQQKPFQNLHQDLSLLNQKVILELFPRQPGRKLPKDSKPH